MRTVRFLLQVRLRHQIRNHVISNRSTGHRLTFLGTTTMFLFVRSVFLCPFFRWHRPSHFSDFCVHLFFGDWNSFVFDFGHDRCITNRRFSRRVRPSFLIPVVHTSELWLSRRCIHGFGTCLAVRFVAFRTLGTLRHQSAIVFYGFTPLFTRHSTIRQQKQWLLLFTFHGPLFFTFHTFFFFIGLQILQIQSLECILQRETVDLGQFRRHLRRVLLHHSYQRLRHRCVQVKVHLHLRKLRLGNALHRCFSSYTLVSISIFLFHTLYFTSHFVFFTGCRQFLFFISR